MKRRKIKIRIKLAIDTGEQIEIERGRHADRIVVRRDQLRQRLLQVCPQQQGVSGVKDPAHFSQKAFTRIAIEISDRAPKKQDEQMLVVSAPRGGRQQAVKVWPFETDNADELDLAKLALASGQCGGRKFDRAVRRALAACKSLQNPPRFSPAAASEFGDQDIRF